MAQMRFLMEKALAYAREGGALTGTSEIHFPEPPHPEAFILMGDFNLEPGKDEYRAITGIPDVEFGLARRAGLLVDAATLVPGGAAGRTTWIDPRNPDDPVRRRCLDYHFVHASLAPRVNACFVDEAAVGSDHLPVWLELE
jgi:endonuclease/exonuclease/phosphatase family metal-dependent hydrolase